MSWPLQVMENEVASKPCPVTVPVPTKLIVSEHMLPLHAALCVSGPNEPTVKLKPWYSNSV